MKQNKSENLTSLIFILDNMEVKTSRWIMRLLNITHDYVRSAIKENSDDDCFIPGYN